VALWMSGEDELVLEQLCLDYNKN